MIINPEMKKSQGDHQLETKIPDFNNNLFLRESPTGGLSVWLREVSNISMQIYKSSKEDIEWMDKEQAWILIESSTAKIAICCIYMAVESSTTSPAFKSNQALLEQLAATRNGGFLK